MIRKIDALTDVLEAISMGNEHLDAPTPELVCRILKEIAGLRSGEKNDPPLVNDKRGVGRLTEEALEGGGGVHYSGIALPISKKVSS